MSDEEADLRLTDDDIKELKKWYKDITGIVEESPDKFNERFLKFLGDDLSYGSNRRILARFFNLKDKPGASAKHEFFLKVYHHQVCGDRRRYEAS